MRHRFCTIAPTEYADRALVCNLAGAAPGAGAAAAPGGVGGGPVAVKLLFLDTAYPYAGLSSAFTQSECARAHTK